MLVKSLWRGNVTNFNCIARGFGHRLLMRLLVHHRQTDQIRVRPAQLPCNIMLVSCDSGRGRCFVIITMYNIGNIATDYGDPTTGGIKCRTRHNGSHQSRAERRLHVLCCLPRLLLTQPSTFFWVASHCPHRQVQ